MKSNRLALVLLVGSALTIQAQENDPDVFKARRLALMKQMDGGVAVLYGKAGHSSDADAGKFVQDSDFYYLTGVSEPGAALLLEPNAHRFKEILYLQPRNPEVENWDGRRPPLGDALEKATGFERVSRIDKLPFNVTASLQRSRKAVFLGPIVGATSSVPEALSLLQSAQSRVPGGMLENLAHLIPEMRRIKEPREIEWIQTAVDITGHGIMAAMKALEPGMLEFQLQSVVEHTYEMEGAQFLGFSTILGWGPNTTVLHYQQNNKEIENEGLVLIDTGAAWNHYSADVTRTMPVSGRFTPRERELYELVLQASNAAIEKVRVGADYYDDVHMTAKQILDDAGYGEYFLHGTGHFLGLDVHDVGDYDKPLEAGVVITVEPGIYIADEGIGIRIEDDVLVTRDGPVLLSRHIPRTIQEIENAMAE